MIGNKYLYELFQYEDEDTSINQLLEMLKDKDMDFIISLHNEPVDIEGCDNNELEYLTKISALIDYCLQLHGLAVPDWLRSDKLIFTKPYFHPKRMNDFEKVKLQYASAAPFKARNAYFDLDGIERI